MSIWKVRSPGRVDVVDETEDERAVVVSFRPPRPGVDGVLGRDRHSVVEQQVVAQLEGPRRAVRTGLPRVDQQGLGLERFVVCEQEFLHRVGDRVRRGAGGPVNVKSGDRSAERHGQIAAVPLGVLPRRLLNHRFLGGRSRHFDLDDLLDHDGLDDFLGLRNRLFRRPRSLRP